MIDDFHKNFAYDDHVTGRIIVPFAGSSYVFNWLAIFYPQGIVIKDIRNDAKTYSFNLGLGAQKRTNLVSYINENLKKT